MMEQKTLGSKFSQTNHKDRNLHVKIVEENDLKEKKELAQDFATILQEKKDLQVVELKCEINLIVFFCRNAEEDDYRETLKLMPNDVIHKL